MDYVDRMFGRQQAVNLDNVFKFTDLSPTVQKHLQKVYLTLTCALLAATVGVVVSVFTGIGGLLTMLGFMGCVFGLLALQPTPQNLNKRYLLLAGAAFCQGCSLGPLISLVLATQPGVLLTALLGTCLVFACFSGAAMISRRRSYLFLGGTLSSAMSLMLVLRLGSWLFGGRALVFQAELYGGLLIFMGYVLFDTQMIIEKAYRGEKDHVKHALDLFVDFGAIFVRLLIILMKNAEKREQDKRRRR
ncbi:hypothetical protein WJX72_007986 [[Myrmecia] bisecta]|uniref:Bax inhibitor 1 n=1 Tax=[Myrmecia] bisecta TaxID=41462 RepID=A0AAW1R8W9_9CHLO